MQDPAAADLLARISCDPSDTAAPAEAFQHATQEFERLLGHPTATAAAAADASKGRPSKRQKKSATTPAAADTAVQEAAVPAVPRDVVPQVYRLYCGYVEERLQALLAREEQALAAAAVAQQLFKLLLSAHAAGAAEEGLYRMWVRLATQLQQSKVRWPSVCSAFGHELQAECTVNVVEGAASGFSVVQLVCSGGRGMPVWQQYIGY